MTNDPTKQKLKPIWNSICSVLDLSFNVLRVFVFGLAVLFFLRAAWQAFSDMMLGTLSEMISQSRYEMSAFLKVAGGFLVGVGCVIFAGYVALRCLKSIWGLFEQIRSIVGKGQDYERQ